MNKPLLLALAFVFAVFARAENPKEYQVTGPVVALTESVITIDKNGEKWEIARTPATKVDGELAVGNRVTVHYRMAATSIEGKNTAKENSSGLSRAEKAAKKADEAAEKARQKAK